LSFTSLCWLICAQRCLPQVTLAILQKSISSPSWSLQVHMKPKKKKNKKKNKSFMQVDSFQIKYYLHSFIHKKLMVMINRLWCSQRTKMKKIWSTFLASCDAELFKVSRKIYTVEISKHMHTHNCVGLWTNGGFFFIYIYTNNNRDYLISCQELKIHELEQTKD